MKTTIPTLAALALLLLSGVSPAQSGDMAEIEQISKSGTTLDAEVTSRFPLGEQSIDDDTGINVLIDLSHQANFFAMWRLPRMLRSAGFRATGSQASLDSVLAEGRFSRVRIPVGGRRPFAWWPNARYNVVVTFQKDPRAQEYLPQEVAALKRYVESGGGLVLLGGTPWRRQENEQWPLNKLAKDFGVTFSTATDTVDGVRMPVLEMSSDWERHLSGAQGKPVIVRRPYGRGRVLIIGTVRYIEPPRDRSEDASAARDRMISSLRSRD
jgi:hypothetical protein